VQCAEQLIVLLSDHERAIAEKAFNLLAYIHDKYPSEIVPFLATGMHRSFEYQQTTFGTGTFRHTVSNLARIALTLT
jgi:hypothetical protein